TACPGACLSPPISRDSRTQRNARNFDSLGVGSKKNRAWCGQNADRIHARFARGARLKSHRQRPRADYSAQRAGPDDRAWRRASRTKGPADNKLCATKAEGISWRVLAPPPLDGSESFSPCASLQCKHAPRRLRTPTSSLACQAGTLAKAGHLSLV